MDAVMVRVPGDRDAVMEVGVPGYRVAMIKVGVPGYRVAMMEDLVSDNGTCYTTTAGVSVPSPAGPLVKPKACVVTLWTLQYLASCLMFPSSPPSPF